MKRVLYSGWLTKSPPEKKTHGPWKIFKAQWRRRYFVLSNIHISNVLPGTCPAQLEYFDSEKQSKRKGSINLNNCEQVLVHIESDSYQHIFVVKTTDRGNRRSYYLAADTEEEMERWVDQLRSILVLQDEGPTSFAPRHLNHSQSTNTAPKNMPTIDHRRLVSTPVSMADSSGILSPVSEIADPFDSSPRSGNSQSPDDYFPLNECSSGSTPIPAPRSIHPVRIVTVRNLPTQTSVSSHQSGASEEYYNTSDEAATSSRDSDIYKVPRLRGDSRDSDIYKIPPSSGIVRDSTYDFPPSAQEWNRDSNYDYPPALNSIRDEGHRDSTYDYPPALNRRSHDSESEQPLWECESKVVGDTYDLLPSKPSFIPRSSNADCANYPRSPHGDPQSADDIYDTPPLSLRTSPPLPPPKAHPMAPRVHRYINAAPTPVASNRLTPPTPSRGSADDGVYLTMNSSENLNDTYMPMAQMENFGSQPRRQRSAVQLQPDRIGEKSPKVPVTLPRSFAKESGKLVAYPMNEPVDSCRVTQRTLSFKRQVPSPSFEAIILPQKAGVDHNSSSSEDDDEDSSGRNSVSESLNLKNSGSSEYESPIMRNKPVVQYLDLDLNSSAVPSSVGSQNKIEYNEIDVERTEALFKAKLMLENERKGSDRSET